MSVQSGNTYLCLTYHPADLYQSYFPMEINYDVDPFQIIPGINTGEFDDLRFTTGGDLSDSFSKDGAPPDPSYLMATDAMRPTDSIEGSPFTPMEWTEFPAGTWSCPSNNTSSFQSINHGLSASPSSWTQQPIHGSWNYNAEMPNSRSGSMDPHHQQLHNDIATYAESTASWADDTTMTFSSAANQDMYMDQNVSSSTVLPIPIPQARDDHSVPSSTSPSNSLEWIPYEYNQLSHEIPSEFRKQRRKGRKTKLTERQRVKAKIVRQHGACSNCRNRKCACDPGFPCKSCVKYYGSDLITQPCRGKRLPDLTNGLLPDDLPWYPSVRTVQDFMEKHCFHISDEIYPIALNLGFGPDLIRSVRIVYPTEMKDLLHQHTVYPWPRCGHDTVAARTNKCHPVFPAILADTSDLEDVLNFQLDRVISSRSEFRTFPVYDSPLSILKHIYPLFESSREPYRAILRQAFKLLLLVHTTGNTSLPDPSPLTLNQTEHANIRNIMTHVFGDSGDGLIVPTITKPCFIRSQLGPATSSLARKLLRDTLTRLEPLVLAQKCNHWETTIATLAVLLMAIESVQYHAARLSYHAGTAPPSPMLPNSPVAVDDLLEPSVMEKQFGNASQGDKNIVFDDEPVEQLLSFYRVCYSGCHARLRSGLVGPSPSTSAPASETAMSQTNSILTPSATTSSPPSPCSPNFLQVPGLSAPMRPSTSIQPVHASGNFEDKLRGIVVNAGGYLQQQRSVGSGAVDRGEPRKLFDRLLARLFD